MRRLNIGWKQDVEPLTFQLPAFITRYGLHGCVGRHDAPIPPHQQDSIRSRVQRITLTLSQQHGRQAHLIVPRRKRQTHSSLTVRQCGLGHRLKH